MHISVIHTDPDTIRVSDPGGKGNDRLFAKGDPTTYTNTVNGGRGYDTASLDKNVDTATHVERKTY